MCVIYFVKLNPDKCLPASCWPEHKVITLSYNAFLKTIEKGSQIKLRKGGFLYMGKLKVADREFKNDQMENLSKTSLLGTVYTYFSYIPPSQELYIAEEYCEILDISEKHLLWKKTVKDDIFKKRAMSFLPVNIRKMTNDVTEIKKLSRQPSININVGDRVLERKSSAQFFLNPATLQMTQQERIETARNEEINIPASQRHHKSESIPLNHTKTNENRI